MGCDISEFIECKSISYKRAKQLNNILDINEPLDISWDLYVGNRPYTLDEYEEELSNDEDFYVRDRGLPRNYYLFSILADVRNYGNTITPLSYPKGLPKDVSPILKYFSDVEGSDAHSHSYFTLAELLAVDWTLYTNNFNSQLEDFFKLMDEMKKFSDDGGIYDDVRLVFWFDN